MQQCLLACLALVIWWRVYGPGAQHGLASRHQVADVLGRGTSAAAQRSSARTSTRQRIHITERTSRDRRRQNTDRLAPRPVDPSAG